MLGCRKMEEKILDLSKIFNPLGPCDNVLEAVLEAIYKPPDVAGINRYPDFLQIDIISSISDFLKVPKDFITPCCGISEGISIALKAWGGGKIVAFELEYEVFKEKAKNVTWVESESLNVDPEALVSAVDNKTSLVYISNPNNPTGTYIKKERMEQLFESVWKKNRETVIFLDEAHAEYVEESCIDLVKEGNLVVAKTFSKFYGLAGLRAGYLVASPNLTKITRGEFAKSYFGGGYFGWQHFEANISRPSESALIKALEHHQKQKSRVSEFMKWAKGILQRSKVEYIEPSAGFVLVNVKNKEKLEKLDKERIKVKHVKDFWVRMTMTYELESVLLLLS